MRSQQFAQRTWQCQFFAVLIALTIGTALLSPRSADARWKKIYQNPTRHGFRAGFFLNEQFGLIGGTSNEGIFITRNGGQSWSNTKLPGSPTANVSQIRMLDANLGFVTLDAGDQNPPILYKTTDGGATWNSIAIYGSGTDVYSTPAALIVSNRRENAGVQAGTTYISTNIGNTFTTSAIMQGNGIDFVDNVHGVMVTYKGHVWMRTTDGGLTWLTLAPNDTTESWGVYGVKGTGTFFTGGENDQTKYGVLPIPHSDVHRSDDFGATWRSVATAPIRSTGHITGFGPKLFIQADTTRKSNGNLTGIWRSTNNGVTWQSIGGPSNDEDTRFVVLGCRGEVIIAFDEDGGVWKTDDGGDGSQPQYQFAYPNIRLDSIAVCSPTDTTVAVTNVGCDTIFITDARSLQTTPDVVFLNADGSPITLPIVIPPGGSAEVRMQLSQDAAGPISASARITTTRSGSVHDDTVHITGTVTFKDVTSTSSALSFPGVSICDVGDSIVTLFNPGCLPLHILSVKLYRGSSFVLDPVTQPDSIASGASKDFGVRFTPSVIGTATDSVIFTYEVFGVQRRISIPISGNGLPDKAAFELAVDTASLSVDTVLEFGTLTRCDPPKTLTYTITNPGCTNISVVPVQIQDSNHRQLFVPTKQLWWQTMTGAASVKVGDKLTLQVRVTPATLGEVKGYVKLSYTIQGAARKDFYLPYHATIVRGPVTLTLDDRPRSFDSIQFCAQKDLVIPIRNDGCDTMRLTLLDLVSSDFTMVNAKKLPVVVPPNSSQQVTLRYIPSQSGPATGVLNVESDADSAQNRTIVVTGYATPTDTISFTAYTTNQVVRSGDTALVVITSNRSMANKSINVVTVTLQYNGDIMTPWPATAYTDIPGANVILAPEVRAGGKTAHQTINVLGTNMSIDSGKAVAALLFRITLSDSSQTDFHIEKVTFNNNTTTFPKCVLGSVVDSGTIGLQFECGDPFIYQYLLKQKDFKFSDGIRFVTGSIVPNPIHTGETAKVEVDVSLSQRFEVNVVDASGNGVQQQTLHLSTGRQTVAINTALLSGTYHLLIRDEAGRAISTQFVVER